MKINPRFEIFLKYEKTAVWRNTSWNPPKKYGCIIRRLEIHPKLEIKGQGDREG